MEKITSGDLNKFISEYSSTNNIFGKQLLGQDFLTRINALIEKAYLESRETEDRKWTTSDLEKAFYTGRGSSLEYSWFEYLQEIQEKK